MASKINSFYTDLAITGEEVNRGHTIPSQFGANSIPDAGGGRCKATGKRAFKVPWREAGPPNYHGFGPVGCE